MRRVIGIPLVFIMFAGTAAFCDIVTFQNTELEHAVRHAVSKPSGDITDADMATITEIRFEALTCEQSLSGIEYCVNIESLYIDYYSCFEEDGNARIAEIAALTGLKSLTIGGGDAMCTCCAPYSSGVNTTQVDLTPLASLTNLQWLRLYMRPPSLAPLKSLSALKTLISPAETLEELAEVATLTQVEELRLPFFVWKSQKDLSALAGMTSLRDLMMEGVGKDLNSQDLISLPQVEVLSFYSAEDSLWPEDRKPLDFIAAFPNLRQLSIGLYCPVGMGSCAFSDYSSLGQLTHLERLTLNNPPAIDLSFVASLPNLEELWFHDDRLLFEIEPQDLSPLADALAESPRPFTLTVDRNYLITEDSCATVIPQLCQAGVAIEGDVLESCPCFAIEVQEPGHQSVYASGNDISLAATFGGNPPAGDITYQWYQDGEELAGEVESMLEIVDADVDDSGAYTCTAIWTNGSAVTPAMMLVVASAASLPALSLAAAGLLFLVMAALTVVLLRPRSNSVTVLD